MNFENFGMYPHLSSAPQGMEHILLFDRILLIEIFEHIFCFLLTIFFILLKLNYFHHVP